MKKYKDVAFHSLHSSNSYTLEFESTVEINRRGKSKIYNLNHKRTRWIEKAMKKESFLFKFKTHTPEMTLIVFTNN